MNKTQFSWNCAFRVLVAAAASAFVMTASADVLVYEGFSSSDYPTAGHSLNGKKNGNKSVGLDTATGWNSSIGVFVSQTGGILPLPESWTNSATVHGVEEGRGVLSSGPGYSTSRANRAQQRALTCEWPTSGSVYFRYLIRIPGSVMRAGYLSGEWNYCLAGFGSVPIANPASDTCTVTNGFYMGVRNRNNELEAFAYVQPDGKDSLKAYPLFTVDTTKTLDLVCVAKIDIGQNGNDTLSLYACPVSEWDDNFAWSTNIANVGFISGSSPLRYLQLIAQHKTNYEWISFDEFIVTTDEFEAYVHGSPLAPRLGDASLSRGASGYSLTATEWKNAADLSYILDCGTSASTNGAQSVAAGGTASWQISGMAPDKTWQVSAFAENDYGSDERVAGTLYSGELTLGATTDANEDGLVAGGVTVSRMNADPFPLTVNYTISGSAGSQGATWTAPVAVTIPANAKSATLPVVPLIDGSVREDVTITVTLAPGNYEIPAAASATLSLLNLPVPTGYNVWLAQSDGLASVASNWSLGRAPASGDAILFDGNYSGANCEWDTGSTVASWTQTANYAGTVTVDTVFPDKGAFTLLTVTGNMTVSGGTITHKAHTSDNKVDVYRLRLNVGGDLTVASGAKISARAKGSYGPRTTGESAYGGSYSGHPSWGSLTEPYGVGSSANDNGTYTCFAGGAVWIEVTGSTILDGAIDANGIEAAGKWDAHAGSGGAVYLKTVSLSGVGTISADCESTGRSSNHRSAAGGRVSVLLTGGELDPFPHANITAFAGNTSYNHVGGVGTVLVRTPQKSNGILYLRDRSEKYGQYGYRPRPNQLTCIPAGQTWAVDEIVFGNNAILQVPTGTTLSLPGGLASVSSTGNTLDETGLIVDGGTLLLPNTASHTISGKWIFEPTDYTLNGNLTVTDGAGVGTLLLYSDTTNNVRTCGLTVTGNMTVDSDAYLRAVRGGFIATNALANIASAHGGARRADSIANRCYDSFFHPRHPGAFGVDNGLVNVGGGAIRLAVGGTLTLNGVATATPVVNNNRSGAGGSIDITAARLEGSGRIEANGNSRNYDNGGSSDASGGGRIAVRLTGAGETFSDAWVTNINAKGFYSSKITELHSSSAGSVYLQTAAQEEGAGTIIIRNTGDTDNNLAVTSMPSVKGGGENDDFRKATLRLEAAARVQLHAMIKMSALEMEPGTVLDLNGGSLAVKSARLGTVRLACGTYTASSAAVAGYVVDSGSAGTLTVSGGFSFVLR